MMHAFAKCDRLEEKFGAWELFEQQWDKMLDKCTLEFTPSNIEYEVKRFPVAGSLPLGKDEKDNGRANELRTKGNEMYHPKVKRYIEAAKLYNESISFAEKGSVERALAYANRSAVCYELGQYDDCLENIRLARASNYPERLADKLKKREENATEALQKDANNNKNLNSTEGADDGRGSAITIQLTYDAYETAPQVANCLELHESENFGRYVATNRELNAGDVVLIEKPFCNLLLDVYRCVRCDFCHQDRLLTLLPCEGCTIAMYCSAECMRKAYLQYHRYECPIIRDMWRNFTKIPLMALRTVTSAIASFDHNLGAMREHLDELNPSDVNAFTMDWRMATACDIYDTVHVLATNEKSRDPRDLGQRIFFANIIRDLLLQRTELGTICTVHPNISRLLVDLLQMHLQTSPVNMHSLYYMEYQPHEEVYNLDSFATGCFPLLSMLNHACAPNLSRITMEDGRCAILINRPIPAGGQLYDNYGMHHCLMPRKERQTKLLKQYKFLCKCEACENNYPMFTELPSIDLVRHGAIDTKGIHADLVLHQSKKAAELLPQLQIYLNAIGREYPRYEISSTQELFLRCFEILHMPTSKIAQHLKFCNP